MKRSYIIGIAALAFIGTGAWFVWSSGTMRYIQKTTGISFPKGITDLDVYDSGDNYVVAYLKIPVSTIPTFVAAYSFRKVQAMPASFFGSERLKPEHRQLPAIADVYGLEGGTKQNRWEVILDRQSGALLIAVMYPDHAGDNPQEQKVPNIERVRASP